MQSFLSPVAFFLVTAATSFAQTTWHVDASATPPGIGTASQPYADLQFALAQPATADGDTLLVEPGLYIGPFDFLGKDVVVRSTLGIYATALDGNGQDVSVVNFVGGESAAAVLDGFTIRGGFGTPTSSSPSAPRTGGGIRVLNSSPTLVNLQIENNSAVQGSALSLTGSSSLVSHCGFSWNDGGPAVTSNLLTTVIQDCLFEFNGTASSAGGGFSGRALLRDCVFRSNQAQNGGGASSQGATFERCIFESNVATTAGGGIFHSAGSGSQPTNALECQYIGNSASVGGGTSSMLGGTMISRNSIFRGNTAHSTTTLGPTYLAGGGAAALSQLFDCEVVGNSAVNGGGLNGGQAYRCRIHENSVPTPPANATVPYGGGGAYGSTLVDCDVYDNVVEPWPASGAPQVFGHGGGALRCGSSGTRFYRNHAQIGAGAAGGTLDNCTLIDNVATIGGGSFSGTVGTALNIYVKNTIARGGIPNEVALPGGSVAVVTYSDIQGGYPGAGNFDADPLFFAPHSDDFHVKPGSPCIDTGDPSSPLDADGSRADVGAWPFDANYCSSPGVWCAGKVNSQGCVPAMGSTGTPSATGPDDFFVTASNFLGANFGLLAWSRTPNSIPFQGGTLCLSGPFFRAGLQFATGTPGACDGTYSFPFSQSYRAAFGINTFETIYAQWFARDALNPDGTGWSLSNAIEFTVCP